MFVPENNITLLDIDGEISFDGRGDFAPGVSIYLAKGATLNIGREFFINGRVRIVCHERIDIGAWARIAWESQLIDTNFHYIQEVETGSYLSKSKPVRIGKCVWIGNRTTVNRGAIIPDYCIVASNSLCTKNYSDVPANSIIGGVPARFLKTGYRRIFSYEEELAITKELGLEPM